MTTHWPRTTARRSTSGFRTVAGAAVRDEAERLVSAGHRLTTRRGKAVAGEEALASQLLEMTLALRTAAFKGFEEACKSVGLMAGRSPSAAKRRKPQTR